MHFLLVAAACWLTALSVNMSRGFRLRAGRPGGGGERRRFLRLCAVAWAVPAALSGAAAATFLLGARPLQKRAFGGVTKRLMLAHTGPWYIPSFIETRTCFGDLLQIDDPQILTTKKFGSLIFYFGPLSILLLVNVVCLSRTARRVHGLRGGNAMLHKEDDGKTNASQAQSVMVYVKLLLCTGLMETLLEVATWAGNQNNENVFRVTPTWSNHAFTYRCVGFVCDLLRALSVLWLAAPGFPARVADLCKRLAGAAPLRFRLANKRSTARGRRKATASGKTR